MPDLNGGHLVARTLKQAGVGHIFTLCGGHILPIYDGCITEGIEVVDARHEQAAAHAGDAYARLTRNIGVAAVTAGPGVTDAVTGVANAYSARSPLLLIGGAAPLGLRGLGSLQEVEQVDLLGPITKGSWTVSETRQIPEVLTTAIRTALTGRPGPVFVEIPVDLLMTMIEDRFAPIPTAYVHRRPLAPDPESTQKLADLLAGAARPMVMAGSGVYWDDAAADLEAFAMAAGMPVFMNGAGRGGLPGHHPLAFSQARGFALGQADFVLVLGTPLDFRLGYGRPPSFAENARVVVVDCDPAELGRNRPLELGLASHIGLTLQHAKMALPKNAAARFETWRRAIARKETESQERLMALRFLPCYGLAPRLEPRGQVGRQRVLGRAKREPDVRREPEGEGPVASQLDRIAVDHDHLRMIGKGRGPAVAEPKVQRRAQNEDEVGLAQGEAARLGESERMVTGEAAAPGAVHEHGHTRGHGKCLEIGGRVVPVHAAAGHHHGPLRAREKIGELLGGF